MAKMRSRIIRYIIGGTVALGIIVVIALGLSTGTETDRVFEVTNQYLHDHAPSSGQHSNPLAGTYVKRAQLHAQAFDYDSALADMNTAIELAPDAPELYVLRGQMWLLLYEWDNVLEDYNRAIDLDPTYSDAYFFRGVLYYSVLQAGLAWREDALADFMHYLELAPDGDRAEQAQTYAETIRVELNALNN